MDAPAQPLVCVLPSVSIFFFSSHISCSRGLELSLGPSDPPLKSLLGTVPPERFLVFFFAPLPTSPSVEQMPAWNVPVFTRPARTTLMGTPLFLLFSLGTLCLIHLLLTSWKESDLGQDCISSLPPSKLEAPEGRSPYFHLLFAIPLSGPIAILSNP